MNFELFPTGRVGVKATGFAPTYMPRQALRWRPLMDCRRPRSFRPILVTHGLRAQAG